MSKLIIHETDCHGSGIIHYNGMTERYSYDDGDIGDVRLTVEALIEFGFINEDDVLIFDDNNDIYHFLEKLIDEKGENENA